VVKGDEPDSRAYEVHYVDFLARPHGVTGPALAATTRVDVTTSNTTFTLPNPWLESSPVGLPAPGHFGGSVFYSTTTNGTATFSFTGTGVSLVAATWYNRGIAAVSVDGGAETLVDMYSPSPVITLYDTTLRDGTQREGLSLSVEDKLRVAQRLDLLGVHYVEGGFPGSNPKDIEFFERARDLELETADLSVRRDLRKDTAAEDDPGLRAARDRV
jgi:hypothetical protein